MDVKSRLPQSGVFEIAFSLAVTVSAGAYKGPATTRQDSR